jgi:hypothetical protein
MQTAQTASRAAFIANPPLYLPEGTFDEPEIVIFVEAATALFRQRTAQG